MGQSLGAMWRESQNRKLKCHLPSFTQEEAATSYQSQSTHTTGNTPVTNKAGFITCCSKDSTKGELGKNAYRLYGLELVKGWSLAEIGQNLQSRELLEQSMILG